MPELVTIPNVELIEVGTWESMSGTWTWTTEDIAAAVEAQDDPAVQDGIIRLGHIDPRFDGEPSIGKVQNLRVSDDGMTLVGDLVGVPAWLADIVPSAFPRRSAEGYFDYTTSTGTKHRFVLTGVALLGVSPPAISTLEDIKALYDGELELVAAASKPAAGTFASATFPHKEPAVPQARLSVNIEDVRGAFYDAQPQGSWAWVREVWSDFIIADDGDGELFKIPWSESDGKVTFGDPERVEVQYVPAADSGEDNDNANIALMARFAPDGDDQRLGTRRVPSLRGATRITLSGDDPQGRTSTGGTMPLTNEQLTALGLSEDASSDQIVEALLAAGEYAAAERDALAAASKPEEVKPAATPQLPDGIVAIDAAQLEELKVAAGAGATARAEQLQAERDRVLNDAVKAGKFPPARLGHFQGLWDKDPEGTREFVEKTLAAGAVPLEEVGHGKGGDATADEALLAELWPEPQSA